VVDVASPATPRLIGRYAGPQAQPQNA